MNDKEIVSIKLAHFIRERRKELKITQEQLAERSGIDYKHIQNLENVRRINDPKYSTLRKLAGGLEMNLLDMVNAFPKMYYDAHGKTIAPQGMLLVSDSNEENN